jgi:RNA polymerase sigma-70 factor (ECF subfamily)
MRAHLLHRRIPRGLVDDLLQGFVTDQIVERNLLAHAQREKGRFRSFLLIALNRYVASELRHQHAHCRSPATPLLALDEQVLRGDPEAPSELFDRAWAKELVGQALCRMKEQCVHGGHESVWGVFHERVVSHLLEGTAPTEYQHLAQRYALNGPAAAANLLTTGKRMFARLLRSLVLEYEPKAAANTEIRELMDVLGRKSA